MDLIEKAIAALPPPARRETKRWRQYEDAKQQLSKLPYLYKKVREVVSSLTFLFEPGGGTGLAPLFLG